MLTASKSGDEKACDARAVAVLLAPVCVVCQRPLDTPSLRRGLRRLLASRLAAKPSDLRVLRRRSPLVEAGGSISRARAAAASSR